MTKSVLVVGAGPVGLTMAAELARYRVPVRIIDQAPAPTDKSKALGVWSRTLELLDRAGCAEAFVSAGLKSSAATIRSGSERIAHIRFDSVASPFQFLLMLPQSETERLMGERVRSLGITIERSVELTGFDDLGQGVSCAIRHADGREETIEASWLIGCDGAHSLVRHKLGMAFEGDTLATNFILADVHVAGFDEAPDERRDRLARGRIARVLPDFRRTVPRHRRCRRRTPAGTEPRRGSGDRRRARPPGGGSFRPGLARRFRRQ